MTTQPLEEVKLPLQPAINTRDILGAKDGKIVNGYVEKDGNGEVMAFKRPGALLQVMTGTPPLLTGMGVSYSVFGHLSIVNSILYAAGVGVAPISSSAVTFSDFANYPQGVFIRGDLTHFYTLTAGPLLTQQTNGSLASNSFVPGVWLLDGTMYMLSGTGTIFGSNINDPTVWPVTNAIAVGGDSLDLAVALAKTKVYLVSLKTHSLNVFYDAGNPTGSPLSPVPGGFADIGCHDARTLQVIGDDLMWAGNSSNGLLGVYLMKDLKVTKVSDGPVEKLIGGSTANSMRTFQMTTPGHRFYGLHLLTANITVVYDLETGFWYEWMGADGNTLPWMTGVSFYSPSGVGLAQDFGTGQVLTFAPNTYTDYNGQYSVTILTQSFDAGTRKKKFLKFLDLVTDQVAGSTLSVSYTDDDYQTFSTPRTLDLSVARPFLANCGTFRKRAWKFTQTGNFPLRLYSAQLSVIKGNL